MLKVEKLKLVNNIIFTTPLGGIHIYIFAILHYG